MRGAMAVRKQLWHPDSVRQKIRASQLVNRLEKHAHGEVDMSPTQISAAVALLDRCVPRLTATEMKLDGEMQVRDTVDRPPRETYEDWIARRRLQNEHLANIPPAGSAE